MSKQTTTPFARQYPYLNGAELASRLRTVAERPELYGPGDRMVLLTVAATRLEAVPPPMTPDQAAGVEHVLAAVAGTVFRSQAGETIILLDQDPYAIRVGKDGDTMGTNLVTVHPGVIAEALDADEAEVGGWSGGYDI